VAFGNAALMAARALIPARAEGDSARVASAGQHGDVLARGNTLEGLMVAVADPIKSSAAQA
jgi:hypothetical protein